ncbi:hypothetical protein AQJ84_05580 [Streptomyces resistomycificus]|uniref:Uncharacterized protein n=1 Tax=Streptomyces resistomycificus TaxID=67356 RepID=A0A0L8L1S7_9ACTN|nr:hypothetical protein ADK37_28825 [Streptomyces resistomycificus]KUO00981.1 hypothetical protein AQJ84_05580 [Streptomyces resistomycificus]
MAVSALSGCVTVQRPSLPGPPAAPSQPSGPRPDGEAEQQIVQAPAREALEMIGPSRPPGPKSAASPGAAPSSPPPRAQEPPTGFRPARSARPEPRRPDVGHQEKPRVDIPDVARSVPRDAKDVCALGRQYGGWEAGSPESMICDGTYGR